MLNEQLINEANLYFRGRYKNTYHDLNFSAFSRDSLVASYDVQIDEHFVSTIPPPQLDFFPAFRSVIASFFLHFLIMCVKSGLEHFDVVAEHVRLGNFRF